MTDRRLTELETNITRILRVGVAVSATTLGLGLVLTVTGQAWAGVVLSTGLVLLLAIPIARIAASFADAVRRGDRLLGFATGTVLVVMALTLILSLNS